MLGVSRKDSRSDKQRKIDNRFITAVAVVASIGVIIIVVANYAKIPFLTPVGVWTIGGALILNLIKGFFDYRKKKKREVDDGLLRPMGEEEKMEAPKRNRDFGNAEPEYAITDLDGMSIGGMQIKIVTADSDSIELAKEIDKEENPYRV